MDDNQDAIELKRRARRRLVGAIALVVFVVIVLPIIFDHEPKSLTQDLSIQIPSQDSGKGATREVSPPAVDAVVSSAEPAIPASQSVPTINTTPSAPIAALSASKELGNSTRNAESPEVPKADAAKSVEQPKSEKKPAEAKTASKPAKDSAKAAPAPVARDDASSTPPVQAEFYVPLGVFSKTENVRQVQSKVSAAGLKSYAEKTAGTTQTKVRAGPFATREAAENARDKLKSAGMDVGPVGSR